ncbi:hypothetical protein NGRA_2820 [Nosema granulosis]|uniref:Uncharacterized protein n=1 Tax=Nosema granulosis TaxID=83296 RepID=A0A9P6GYL1_9MICR|nr:hypothetical protein NGRA_2820 [Nosema granulosis]
MWLSIFIHVKLSLQLYFRNSDSEKYFCANADKGQEPIIYCPRIENALDFQIVHVRDGISYIRTTTGSDMSINVKDGKLLLHTQHASFNPDFKMNLIGPNRFSMINKNKCVDFNEDTKTYSTKDCTYSSNQIFSIVTRDRLDPSMRQVRTHG